MNFKFAERWDTDLPVEYLNATLLASGLSVLVLVGLFHYLNGYTRRRYFTIWTAAWLFYGLWLALHFSWVQHQERPLWHLVKYFSVGTAAAFLIWGSADFLKFSARQSLFGVFLGFILVWSYISAYHLGDSFFAKAPIFGLLGGASILTAWGFFRVRQQDHFIGAGLLALGFLIWGLHLLVFPWWEKSPLTLCASFLSAAVVQLFIAVSMIVLMLEEVRRASDLAHRQIQSYKTETSRLSAKVATTEARYHSLFDQASEGILIAAAENLQILELNPTMERLLGIQRPEAQRHNLKEICQTPATPDQPPPQSASDWFTLFGQRGQIKLARPDGEITLTEVDGAPITFEGRAAYQFFFRELTERVRLEQQLHQAEKLSALGRMISGIAHELNNPLAVVKGYVDLILAHHSLGENTRAHLDKVARESDRATKLIKNFIAFARDQGTHRRLTDLNALVRRVIEWRQFDLSSAGVQVVLDLDPGLPQTELDLDQVEQALVNLVNNAVGAVNEISGSRKLRISTQTRTDLIQVLVEDNGPGVPDHLQPRIFDPFFSTSQAGATGLGLSIAHSIMADHQGSIFYQKSGYGGAGFVLEFPILKPAGIPEPTTAPPAVPQAQDPAGARPAPARILVLDDEVSLAELLGQMLMMLGHETTVCHTGADALQLVAKTDFDLVLSDFRMPYMDGQQFYQHVAAIKPALAKRIIFLSGDVVNEEIKAFLKASGNPSLTKPFRMEKVEQLVTEMLRQKNG